MENDDYDGRARIDNPQSNSITKYDPFNVDAETLKSYDGLHPNFKRRVSRLNKVWTGQDGAKSKQLIPDMDITTAYGLFDVIVPPYNLDELANFYETNFANHAAVNAKVANTVGLGYQLEPSLMLMDRLEDAQSEEQRIRAQRKSDRAKKIVMDWLEELNDEDTFTHVLEKVFTDVEATGNGYIEIGRTTSGEIGYVGHIPSTTIRVRRERDGYIQIVNQRTVFFRNFQQVSSPNNVTTDPRPNELIHIKKYTPRNSYYGVPDILSAATSLVGDTLAGRYNIDYFENKAVPRYIVTLKGAKLSVDAEDKLFRFLTIRTKGTKPQNTLYSFARRYW
jgi:capsid portal protein